MFMLLAKVVEVTPTPEGDHVVVDPMGPMLMSALYLFLVLMPIVIILLFFFYKKKCQHQQIMAAIEKGHPIEDLLAAPEKKEKGSAANISAGIGLLLVAGGLFFFYLPLGVYRIDNKPEIYLVFIPVILTGMGITRLIRGLYQKKEAKKEGHEETRAMPESAPDIQV